jgi:hypothetical protein
MDSETETFAEGGADPKPIWSNALIWSTLGLIGWLTFELTTEPAVGLAVFCSRFGWDDFLTAVWVRRRDPHRGRGRACSWFCLSCAVTNIMVSALVLSMGVAFLSGFLEALQPPAARNLNRQPPAFLLGPLILLMAGVPVLALLAMIGCISARLNRVRVWIDVPLNRARRNNAWPPYYPGACIEREHNRARAPWLGMIAFTFTASGALAFFVATLSGSALIGVILMALLTFGIGGLARDVFANCPQECWGAPDSRDLESSASSTAEAPLDGAVRHGLE